MNKAIMNRSVVIALASASAMGIVGCSSNDEVAEAIGRVTPAGSEELKTANEESAAAMVTPCARCTDGATNEISVHQHATQNSGFTVQGLRVDPLFGADSFRLSLLWNDGSDDVSFFDFGEDERASGLPGRDNDYYYLRNVETGGETNAVFVYALSGDIDAGSSADNTDYLVAGIWLHTPDSTNAVEEVVAFADAHGQPISGSNIVALTGMATYGAIDDNRPEATGYYLNDDNNEVEQFFADAELTANFEATGAGAGVGGAISGRIVNTRGTPFTLILSSAEISNENGGLFRGATVGSSTGDPIDSDWVGVWGGKFFGGDSATATDHPDFVYGTFGARDTASGVSDPPASIVGSFLVREDTTP